ncbi:MAG TPA: serine/threonine protein kinase [Planctomycetes bacterium]|nr:serine/threonine protein kinase [Planctomycetaceae bacterium]HIM31831.1 serine/threonine protein kinase [Planctomycetota bacterium]
MLRIRVVPAWFFTLTSIILLSLNSTARGEDWGQFRGPNASGVSTESDNPPVEFSATDNVRWSVELGKGVACPIVASGRCVTTMLTKDNKFIVMALDAKNGKRLWRREFDAGSKLPEITPPNQHASSTPAANSERVFVHFSTLGMLALNAKTGELLWQHKLPAPFYLMGWGAANSPILYQDMVIFNLDDDLAPYLVALDQKSGDVRWHSERPEMLGGYAVPVLCTVNGRTDIVVAGSGKLIGYDPGTGQERWSCNSLLRTIMTTPVVSGDRIFITVQSYGDTDRVLKYALLQWRDTNQDGKLAKSELEEAFHQKFEKGDLNKDGFLVDNEIDLAFQSPTNMTGGGNIIQSVRGGGEGNVTKTHLVWNLSHRAASNIASPLAYDGRLFVVKKGGISAAFDLKTGKVVWEKKRIRNYGNYFASPVAAGGYIYVPGENGSIVVLRSANEVDIVAKNDIGDSIVASPAIANNLLYVRTVNKLFCFGAATD